MPNITLIIGNKNYSSWSLRPWLALRQSGLPFSERLINIYDPEMRASLREISPSGLVPVMNLDGELIWDTLAIIERVHELAPEAGIWPADPVARSIARSVAAEMHSGFQGLRGACPVNIRARRKPKDRGEAVDTDVTRITEVWQMCRERFGAGGPFLFGAFCAADHMYAPIVTRLRTYAISVDPVSQTYMDAVLDHPDFRAWEEAAIAEEWTAEYDLVD